MSQRRCAGEGPIRTAKAPDLRRCATGGRSHRSRPGSAQSATGPRGRYAKYLWVPGTCGRAPARLRSVRRSRRAGRPFRRPIGPSPGPRTDIAESSRPHGWRRRPGARRRSGRVSAARGHGRGLRSRAALTCSWPSLVRPAVGSEGCTGCSRRSMTKPSGACDRMMTVALRPMSHRGFPGFWLICGTCRRVHASPLVRSKALEVFPLFSAPRRIRRTAPLVRPVRLTLIAGTAVLGATLTACSGASASGSDKGRPGSHRRTTPRSR